MVLHLVCKNFIQHINPGISWKPLSLVLAYWLRLVQKFIVESNYPQAKHRSLAEHSRIAKFLTRLLPGYALGEDRFFIADKATDDVAEKRKNGFSNLARTLQEHKKH